MPDIQELIALAIVAVVVILYLRRRRRLKRQVGSACGGCAFARPARREATLHFHRKRENDRTGGR